jgi:SAM-dependent methyltransferase
MRTPSGDKWRAALEKWSIPQEILDQAPESPWIHPPALFDIPEQIEDSISHQRAREVVDSGSVILDVGCGGGIASFALTPPSKNVIGLDHQSEMLKMYSKNALIRGVTSHVFEGFWPQAANEIPKADVVVCHHVLYNVHDIEDFLLELNNHARSRVVIEIPQSHPLSTSNDLWLHFWNLPRPHGPAPDLLMEVLRELKINAHIELWEGSMRSEVNLNELAQYSRIRLCLNPDKEKEILEYLSSRPISRQRALATIWWDVYSSK